jgi:hypothetical protein
VKEQPMLKPFTLRAPNSDIADLRERLARARFPDSAPGEPWAYGTSVDTLRGLVEYWRGPSIGVRRKRASTPSRNSR